MNNRVKLIDQNKVDAYIEQRQRSGDGSEELWMLQEEMKAGKFDPDTQPVPTIKPGDNVYHNRFKARGEVKKISASGKRAFVIWPGCAPSYVDIKNLEVVE